MLNTSLMSGTKHEYSPDQIDLYTEINNGELLSLLDRVEGKIVRISPELLVELEKFNRKMSEEKKDGKRFVPNLASYKIADKYIGKDNANVAFLDRAKYYKELGLYSDGTSTVSDTILVISQKTGRILGVAYKLLDGTGGEKFRLYIRYTTLTEKSQKAQRIIEIMNQRFGNVFGQKPTKRLRK